MTTDRHINCAGCGAYLGVIRDAKLRKDIAYLCGPCESKRAADTDINNFLSGFAGKGGRP